jgi:hypothetical protein
MPGNTMHDRLYAMLTTPQRTVALFAALARDDVAEAERLADTAPRCYFEGADFGMDFMRVVMAATVAMQRIDRAATGYVAARGRGAALVYRKGEDWVTEAERMAEAAEDFADRMRSIWAALRASLEPLGLDAFEVAGSMVGLTELHRDILAVETVEAEPDAELLETFATILQG